MRRRRRARSSLRGGVALLAVLLFLSGTLRAQEGSEDARKDPLEDRIEAILVEADQGVTTEDRLARRLAELGPDAIPGLIAAYYETGTSLRPPLRRQVLLIAFRTVSSEDLLSILQEALAADIPLDCRLTTLDILTAVGGEESVRVFLMAVAEMRPVERRSPAVRSRIRKGVIDLLQQTPSACRALRSSWKTFPEDLCDLLIESLGDWGGVEGLEILVGLLADSPADARPILGRIAGAPVSGSERLREAAQGTILFYLHDGTPEVRRVAALCAGRLHLVMAVDRLVELIGDADKRVAVAALRSLQRMSGLALGPDRDRWQTWLGSERVWLNESGPQAMLRLASGDSDLVLPTIEALANHRLHRERFLDRLLVLLDDPNSRIRSAVCRAAGKLGAPNAIDALLEALEDPDPQVRVAASIALRSLSPKLAARMPATNAGTGATAGTVYAAPGPAGGASAIILPEESATDSAQSEDTTDRDEGAGNWLTFGVGCLVIAVLLVLIFRRWWIFALLNALLRLLGGNREAPTQDGPITVKLRPYGERLR